MATTYKSIEDEVRKGLSGSYKNTENTLKQNAQTQKNTINTNADTAIKSAEEYYGKQEADTRADYEDKFQSNEVQRVLNERYIARKAAEMGLTDSGLNRTQQTAVQLSYANQKGDLERQRQKAIDTLAAALTAEKTEINTQRNNKLSEIDTTLNTNLANLNSSFENDVITNANARWNTYLENQQKMENNKRSDLQKIYSTLNTGVENPDYAAQMINDYILTYKDTSDLNRLLQFAGISQNEFEHYLAEGSVYMDYANYVENTEYNNTNPTLPMSMGRAKYNYKTDGEVPYTVEIVDATNNYGNWWGANKNDIDNDDRVTLKYPDGTVAIKDVRLDQLPKDIAIKLTNATAGKKDGDIIKGFKLNLKNVNI